MTECELCAHLDVSRVAVREALERLSAIGLLNKKQGAGTFVAKPMAAKAFNSLLPMLLIEEKDLLTVLEFRKHFERGNIAMFMEHHTPEDIQALERNYEEMVAHHLTDPEKSGLLDIEFHQLIAEGTRNAFVIKTSRIIKEIMGSLQAMLFAKIDATNAIEYHREIINNIKRGYPDIAAMFMDRHIENSMLIVRREQERGKKE